MIIALVPAWNEAATIGRVVTGLRAHASVIVVDDGSTDETSERAGRPGAGRVVRHPVRRGKAAAGQLWRRLGVCRLSRPVPAPPPVFLGV